MKRRVEDRDHRDAPAKRRPGCPNASEARAVVQRGQGLEVVDRREDRIVEHGGRTEARAAVDHPVAHGLDWQLRCGEPLGNAPDTFVVVGNTLGRVQRLGTGRLESKRGFTTNPFDPTLSPASRNGATSSLPRRHK
jgi:hypothetical protein